MCTYDFEFVNLILITCCLVLKTPNFNLYYIVDCRCFTKYLSFYHEIRTFCLLSMPVATYITLPITRWRQYSIDLENVKHLINFGWMHCVCYHHLIILIINFNIDIYMYKCICICCTVLFSWFDLWLV